VFILDDGFQHRRVARNLDLVLIDATRPFGCALPLPAGYHKAAQLPLGLLRESPRSLRRADGVILTRADQASSDQIAQLESLVRELAGRPPLARAAHGWAGLLTQRDEPAPLESLADLPVAGVCGIANPQAFMETVSRHAGRLAMRWALRDHQPYDHKLMTDIFERARKAGAEAVVMTEKDYVKCRGLIRPPSPLPIYRPVLELKWLEGGDEIERLLRVAVGG